MPTLMTDIYGIELISHRKSNAAYSNIDILKIYILFVSNINIDYNRT